MGCRASQVAQEIKNLPADAGDTGIDPWSGKFPGGGNDNPLVFLLGKFHELVHGASKSWAQPNN